MPAFIKSLITAVVIALISVISYLVNHEDYDMDVYQQANSRVASLDITQHSKDINKEIRFFEKQIKDRATTGACQVNAEALKAVEHHHWQWLVDSIEALKNQYSQKVIDRVFIGSGVGLHRGRFLAPTKI